MTLKLPTLLSAAILGALATAAVADHHGAKPNTLTDQEKAEDRKSVV